MPSLYRQKTGVKFVFYSHTRGRGAEASYNDDRSTDIVAASITKNLRSPSGGFSVTLVPRRDYTETIFPGDWVAIYLLDGSPGSDSHPYMIGNIDTVQESNGVGGKGEMSRVVRINGRDYGKVLNGINLVFDPCMGDLPNIKAYLSFISTFTVDRNKKGGEFRRADQILPDLIALFCAEDRQQMVAPRSYQGQQVDAALRETATGTPFDVVSTAVANSAYSTDPFVGFQLDYTSMVSATSGKLMFNPDPNLTGTVWSALQQYSHATLNEMFVDTLQGVPKFVLRERPFSRSAFTALDYRDIEADEITSENLTKTDNEVYNWFRVSPEGENDADTFASIAKVGYVCPASIRRHGVRRLTPSTIAWGELDILSQRESLKQAVVRQGLLDRFSGKLAEWYWQNESLVSAVMTCRLRSDIHVGMRLDYHNARRSREMSFYVEGVNHQFQYPQAGTTSLECTRGVPRSGVGSTANFPTLKTLDELISSNDVSSIYDFSQTTASAGFTRSWMSTVDT